MSVVEVNVFEYDPKDTSSTKMTADDLKNHVYLIAKDGEQKFTAGNARNGQEIAIFIQALANSDEFQWKVTGYEYKDLKVDLDDSETPTPKTQGVSSYIVLHNMREGKKVSALALEEL